MTRNNKTKKNKGVRHNKTIKGGVGASTIGIHVYGDMDKQMSVVGTSNAINTNSTTTFMASPDQYANKMVVDKLVGGSENQLGGKITLTEIAVPAVLLYTNNIIGTKKKQRHKKARNRKPKGHKKVRFSRKIKG